MKLLKITLLIISLLLCLSAAKSLQDGWIEEAVVFPVPNSNYILTQFQFSVEASTHSPVASTISPALWDLIKTHNFQTLELTLTRGHWPFSSSSTSSNLPPPLWAAVPPPGLELKVEFPAPAQQNNATTYSATEPIKSNKDLQALGHALSSLVAASVPTLVDHGVWASPAVGWWRWWSRQSPTSGNTSTTDAVRHRQLYGVLTQEGPCVENVSAWLKLLPCRGGGGRSGGGGLGLAGVLQAENFVTAPLHSLQLAIDASGSDGTGHRIIRVMLGFTLLQRKKVDDVLYRASTKHRNPISALHFAASSGNDNVNFDDGKSFSCPAMAQSSILLPKLSEIEEGEGLQNENCIPIPPVENSITEMQLCTLTPPPTQGKGDNNSNTNSRTNLKEDEKVDVSICPPTKTIGNTGTASAELKSQEVDSGGGASGSGSGDLSSSSSSSSSSSWILDVSSSMIPLSTQITKLSLNALIIGPSSLPEYHHHHTGNSGRSSSTIYNNKNSTDFVLVHILQMVPWEVAVRWHTLTLSYNGIPVLLNSRNNRNSETNKEGERKGEAAPGVVWQNFQSAQSRGNAVLIEILLKLPLRNHGQVHLQVEIKKKLLTVFDFPPDASRGIDVPSALVTFVPPPVPSPTAVPQLVQTNRESVYNKQYTSLIAAVLGCTSSINSNLHAVPLSRHSSPHLLNLPIPDASMPFNVVCFTSTVIALTFGSALNAMLTKAPQGKRKVETDAEEERLKRRRVVKLKLLRVLVVLLVVGMTAIYMDKDLQRQADAWVVKLAAFWPSAPGSHQPEL